MDKSTWMWMAAAVAVLAFSAAPAFAAPGDDGAAGTDTVELVYEVTTGEVWIENAGGFGSVAFGSLGNVLPAGEDLDGLGGVLAAYKDTSQVLYQGVASQTSEQSVGLMLASGLDIADIIVFGQNQGGSQVYGVVTEVPEPATMALLGLGGLAALIRRRK